MADRVDRLIRSGINPVAAVEIAGHLRGSTGREPWIYSGPETLAQMLATGFFDAKIAGLDVRAGDSIIVMPEGGAVGSKDLIVRSVSGGSVQVLYDDDDDTSIKVRTYKYDYEDYWDDAIGRAIDEARQSARGRATVVQLPTFHDAQTIDIADTITVYQGANLRGPGYYGGVVNAAGLEAGKNGIEIVGSSDNYVHGSGVSDIRIHSAPLDNIAFDALIGEGVVCRNIMSVSPGTNPGGSPGTYRNGDPKVGDCISTKNAVGSSSTIQFGGYIRTFHAPGYGFYDDGVAQRTVLHLPYIKGDNCLRGLVGYANSELGGSLIVDGAVAELGDGQLRVIHCLGAGKRRAFFRCIHIYEPAGLTPAGSYYAIEDDSVTNPSWIHWDHIGGYKSGGVAITYLAGAYKNAHEPRTLAGLPPGGPYINGIRQGGNGLTLTASESPAADAGGGEISLTTWASNLSTTAGGSPEVWTLDDGYEGQIKEINFDIDGGATLRVTPTNFHAGDYVDLEDAADKLVLQFTARKWGIISNSGGTVS